MKNIGRHKKLPERLANYDKFLSYYNYVQFTIQATKIIVALDSSVDAT